MEKYEKEIAEIDDKLAHLHRVLFDAEDPMEMDWLTKKEKEKIYQELHNLNDKRDSYYKILYEDKLRLHPDSLNNSTIKSLIDSNDYDFNYLLMCLLEKAPIIYQDKTITQIIYTYICKTREKCKALYTLLKFDKKVFENEELLFVINTYYFEHLKEIFYSSVLMSDNNFIQFLLTQINNRKISIENYYSDIRNMERAFQAKLDYELILQIGCCRKWDCEKALDYFEENMGPELFNSIAAIKNKAFKKYLLSVLFYSTEKEKINILEKFFNIQEIREQLLNPNSFYYQFLILPLQENGWTKSYGTKEELFYFQKEVFEDFDFEGMIHYFDSLVSHYIYYYENGKIQRVPVLSYVATSREKINTFLTIQDTIASIDIDAETQAILEEKYSNILNTTLLEKCIKSLDENKNKDLTNEEIAYWDYLMQLSSEEEEKLTLS